MYLFQDQQQQLRFVVTAESVPGRKGTAGKESLGSPFAQVHGESDAVPVVSGENYHLFAARMLAEDRAHFFGEENRAAPAMSDAHGCKDGVQIADTAFEPAETVGRLAAADIITMQIMRAVFARTCADRKARRRAHVSGEESGAIDDAVRIEQASPQIG